jgi:hypothetical protein
VIEDRNHGAEGRTTIPIKQYSNKFFQEMEKPGKKIIAETPKFNNQKRFNILLKKKQMFGKHVPLRQMKDK